MHGHSERALICFFGTRFPMADKIFVSWFLCGKSFAVETVTKLTNELVASYARLGGINHLDRSNLPSKQAIATLCNDLLHLLFPGFFSEEAVSSEERPSAAQEIIDQIADQLESVIAVSLKNRDDETNPNFNNSVEVPTANVTIT